MTNTRTTRFIAILTLCAILCAVFVGCSPQSHTHAYVDGACSTCGKACEHSFYVGGKCVDCGTTCEHNYIKGICIICNFVCTHEYADGVCLECGYVCTHSYVDGKCSTCGKMCEHNYVNGVCNVCSFTCTHEYVDGACAKCGYVCTHSYDDGVCGTCGKICEHEHYTDGECDECGKACEQHDYVHGMCTTCGSVKPAHYDYTVNYAAELPRIDIRTMTDEGASALMTTANMGFNGQPGSKDNRPYYDCVISVGNCADEYELSEVAAEVKIRGNYTANYPKKPFRIKFGKKQGMLGLNGGQKFKSWVLLADYKDISMTRNALTFYLSKQILGSDDLYSTDFAPVELYLNNEYWGMYLLAEQQQVNAGRVDITQPEKNDQGTDIGYLVEYDGYYQLESYAERFSCDYNGHKPLKTRSGSYVTPPYDVGYSIKNDVYYDDEQTCAQKHFIKGYISNLYKLCYEAVYNHKYYAFSADKTELVQYVPKTNDPVRETVERVIDVRSLVDVYIINEIACDADIAWSSFYMDVDFGAGGDGIMRFEAPWDFDSSLGLKDTCMSGEGLFAANSNNPWLVVFINEDWFWNAVKAKWRELDAANVMDAAREFIRLGRALYADDYRRNFDRWGFVKDGELNYIAKQISNHAGAVDHLLDWFSTRVLYLDKQWL